MSSNGWESAGTNELVAEASPTVLPTLSTVRADVLAARDVDASDLERHLVLQQIIDALDRVEAALQRIGTAQAVPGGALLDETGAELERANAAAKSVLEPALRQQLAALAVMFDDAVSDVLRRSRSWRSGAAVGSAPRLEAAAAAAAAALPLPAAPPAIFGAGAPAAAAPGAHIAVQFVAYREGAADAARALLSDAQAGARVVLEAGGDPLAIGTKVEVALSGAHLTVEGQPRDVQRFVWAGRTTLLGFEVEVAADATSTVLRLDVMVDGIVLAKIRLPLEVSAAPKPEARQRREGVRFARKAFASYSSKDRERVLDRVAAIRIAARMHVFLDCHDLNPGEAWEPNLAQAIDGCDIFLLFWSDAAAVSTWVQWEWKRALRQPGLDHMQFHPLENGVKPPGELATIHLGDPYMDLRAAERVRRASAAHQETT